MYFGSVFGSRLLVIRETAGTLRVFEIPTYGDTFLLPDLHWYRFGARCRNFAPESENGVLRPDGVIRCLDTDSPQQAEYRWSYSGKNLGKHTEAMLVPEFFVEGKFLVLGRRP
jgi:hypothetical protein